MGDQISLPFGGPWTRDKVEIIQKYLKPYTTIMNKQPFSFSYIDAFAGTGSWNPKESEKSCKELFPEIEYENPFEEGSAKAALNIKPDFNKYVFIEKDEESAKCLYKLKDEFPEKADNIEILHQDANEAVKELCNYNWIAKSEKAVIFLDPYGMQVEWSTIEAIAKTKAIDLWLLFPIGVAINRLLTKNGEIKEGNQRRLNLMFGEEGWYGIFYKEVKYMDLFGEERKKIEKTADFKLIEDYFIARLKTIFPGVAENPRILRNKKNNPLYLLCFACANKKGSKTAVRIATHILEKG